MKMRGYSDMEAAVASAGSGSVFAVAGPDLYQCRRLREAVIRRFTGTYGFETVMLEGAGLKEGDLKRHVLENSLFAPGRLLVVSSVHSLSKAPASELLQVLEDGFTDNALFLYSHKLPRESAIVRKLEKRSQFFVCYEPFERDMAGWVSRLATEEDIRLGRGVAGLLMEYSGRDLGRLSGAMEKLSLYHGRGAKVDMEGMVEVLAGKGVPDIFHLGDLVFGGSRGEALSIAWSLLIRGEEPVAMLSYLFGVWQKVVTARHVMATGGGKREVSAATGSRFPVLDKVIRFARRDSGCDPAVVSEAFAAADRGIKTGEDQMLVFGRLIFTLTRSC